MFDLKGISDADVRALCARPAVNWTYRKWREDGACDVVVVNADTVVRDFQRCDLRSDGNRKWTLRLNDQLVEVRTGRRAFAPDSATFDIMPFLLR